MPTLLDHIDRFSYTAQAIQSAARNVSEPLPNPYVRAVLQTPLGDLARDVDTSELGLFTLMPNASTTSTSNDDSGVSSGQKGMITRVEFPGATPLRKPIGTSKHMRRDIDKEPEVYAQAALKYLDRYQSIRPMPKARQELEAILERLSAIRSEIEQLGEGADQSVVSASQPVPSIQDEEKRIRELHLRIKQMKARKEVLGRKQGPHSKSTVLPTKDKEEDAFWSEPATARKPGTSRKSLLIPTLARGAVGPDDSLLLDSHMKVDMGAMLGDVSMSSLADEAPTPVPATKLDPATVPLPSRSHNSHTPSPAPSPSPSVPPELQAVPETPTVGTSDESADTSTDEGDGTIVLTKPPVLTPARPPTPPPAPSTPPPPIVTTSETTPAPSTTATPKPGATATPGTARIGRIRITADLERIVAKAWSTVGIVIMPGHKFNTAAAATTDKPPRAKETIALLQNLAAKKPPSSPPPASHSTFSIMTDTRWATTQAILTAHLLLALLNAAPQYTLPLADCKAVLAEANKKIGNDAPEDPEDVSLGIVGRSKEMEMRALYGCVAKRLLKIDRTTRQQLVKFDM